MSFFYFRIRRKHALTLRAGDKENRSDICMPREVGWDEMHPPSATSCCRADQRAPVPSGCEQAERNLWPPPLAWSVSTPTKTPPAFWVNRWDRQTDRKWEGWRGDGEVTGNEKRLNEFIAEEGGTFGGGGDGQIGMWELKISRKPTCEWEWQWQSPMQR